jgi:hypothetical protein
VTEPAALTAARRHLARAEAGYLTADGLSALEGALALIEEVVAGGAGSSSHAAVARNLAGAYLTKLHERIRERAADPGLPETQCEHLFRTLIAFDASSASLPAGVHATKVALARKLIDRYYEGHSPEAKAKALAQLAGLSEG